MLLIMQKMLHNRKDDHQMAFTDGSDLTHDYSHDSEEWISNTVSMGRLQLLCLPLQFSVTFHRQSGSFYLFVNLTVAAC